MMKTHDKDGKEYTLKPGVDETARSVFIKGQCHALALCAHEKYGYPMHFVGDRRGWRHVVVQIDEDLFADILGVHTKQEVLKKWDRWSNTQLLEISTDDLFAYINEHLDNPLFGFNMPDLEAGTFILPFAKCMWDDLVKATRLASRN